MIFINILKITEEKLKMALLCLVLAITCAFWGAICTLHFRIFSTPLALHSEAYYLSSDQYIAFNFSALKAHFRKVQWLKRRQNTNTCVMPYAAKPRFHASRPLWVFLPPRTEERRLSDDQAWRTAMTEVRPLLLRKTATPSLPEWLLSLKPKRDSDLTFGVKSAKAEF